MQHGAIDLGDVWMMHLAADDQLSSKDRSISWTNDGRMERFDSNRDTTPTTHLNSWDTQQRVTATRYSAIEINFSLLVS